MDICIYDLLTTGPNKRYYNLTPFLILKNDTPIVTEDRLILFSYTQKTVLFWIFVILTSAAIIGNTATMFYTTRRNYRPLQKAFILSLAFSDFNLAILYGTVNIVTVAQRFVTWQLGTFMCHFVPHAQMFCLLANSMTLMSIGFDRYKNIVKSLWNPGLCVAFIPIVVIWISSILIAYPIENWYLPKEIYVITFDENQNPADIELHLICQTTQETKIDYRYYYMGLFVGIFIPLLLCFLWFYYKIAVLIWKRRKPPTTRAKSKQKNVQDSVCTETTVSTQQQSRITVIAKGQQRRFCMPGSQTKGQRAQVERKLRTFRIILLLMAAFFICRLPFWVMSLVRLIVVIEEDYSIMLLYGLSALGLLNCVLNPFLYTFLNETITVLKKIGNFFQICSGKIWFCSCCSVCKPSSNMYPNNDENNSRENCANNGERISQKKIFIESPVFKIALKNETMESHSDSVNGTYKELEY